MRLRIILPKVNPEAIPVPTRCAYAGCRGSKFYLRQEVAKPLRDTVYHEVQVHRYQCLRVQTDVPGRSRRHNACPDLATSERASGDAVSAGVKLWGDLLSESALLGSTSVRVASMTRYKRRPSWCLGSREIRCLQGSKHPTLGRRSDQRQMQGGVVTFRHH